MPETIVNHLLSSFRGTDGMIHVVRLRQGTNGNLVPYGIPVCGKDVLLGGWKNFEEGPTTRLQCLLEQP